MLVYCPFISIFYWFLKTYIHQLPVRLIAQLVEPRTGISDAGYEIPSGSKIFGSSLSLLLKWHSLANWDDPVNFVSHSTFQHVTFEVIIRLLKVLETNHYLTLLWEMISRFELSNQIDCSNLLYEYCVNCGHTNETKMWSSQLWLLFKQSQSKAEKCFRGFNGIRTHGFCVSAAMLTQRPWVRIPFKPRKHFSGLLCHCRLQ